MAAPKITRIAPEAKGAPAIIPRAEAKARGLPRYFIGRPCPKGHIADRWVHGGCVICRAQRRKVREDINRVRDAFNVHRRSAARRGIPFLLTFEEWWGWWQTDDRWSRRGRGKDQLVMARPGDTGPYSIDNIVCFTKADNIRDMRPEVRAAAAEKLRAALTGGGAWAGVRGDGHPGSRPVLTPAGRFGSIALAAEFFGVGRSAIGGRIRKGWPGWRFAPPLATKAPLLFDLDESTRSLHLFWAALVWVRSRPYPPGAALLGGVEF